MNNIKEFMKECEGIYRLKVQFTTVYTSIFLIETEIGDLLVDAASCREDVETCLILALAKMGKSLSDVFAIVITHGHIDHEGGLARILELAPNMKVIREAKKITDDICTYPLPGHTEDSIGLFDKRTGTLISGDALQGAGVDQYRCNVAHKDSYIATIERIKKDEKIERILFSHAYEPWYSDKVSGRINVCDAAEKCKEYL